ncbi:hypothetical protein DHBDCA_p1358 [Dehalobacter sp. DCA]|jgi:hypothetical protein|uniref:DUF6103 family protein n=1 Tax=Dehalobacter sp. DCA TaxID=1147129 RepID=UPI00028B34B8|nr:DUF6103 family protein [Dehalobacter sp. DCA]AFV02387.1 hypothetical protein DHBDCA_p1358 [Dehalobacter sp. DCA]
MKKTTVQITFEAEKLRAIHQYMEDETELQAELDTLLQTLYEKHVPAPVREYIESRDTSVMDSPKRSTRPATPGGQSSPALDSEE